VVAVRAVGATKTTVVTAMVEGTNNNQLKAIRGSGRNSGGGGSGGGGVGNQNSNSNGNRNRYRNDIDANTLCTPLKAILLHHMLLLSRVLI
jgi:hypothetical protein